MKSPFLNLIFCMPLLFVACIELISPNVSDVTVPLQNPPDSLFTDREIIDFRWEANELVEAYHFQLFVEEGGQPYLLLDTLLAENTFRLKLTEGSYTWQVQAQNASSASSFQAHQLCVDRSPPMLPQAIFPLAGDTIFQNQVPAALRWVSGDRIGETTMSVRDSVYMYQWVNNWPVLVRSFELDQKSEKIIRLSEAFGESYQLKPGEYRWEVKSFDQVGYTSCSRLFNFFLQ
jgi:hypothetical protein